jgi:hypothetical protein
MTPLGAIIRDHEIHDAVFKTIGSSPALVTSSLKHSGDRIDPAIGALARELGSFMARPAPHLHRSIGPCNLSSRLAKSWNYLATCVRAQ